MTERLTGRLDPYGKLLTRRDGPYGKGRSSREAPYGEAGGFLRETPLITGKLTGSYGEGLYQNWAGISACVP